MPDRVYITGGPGAGKTTFAQALGERTGAPIHSLDEIARVGGGRGPETGESDRATAVAAILAQPRWIAEGVQLGWTTPLIAAADKIVWLDYAPPRASTVRIFRRFVSGGIAEFRRRRGRERFLRVRDYGRKLRELAVSVPETRTFPRDELEAAVAPHSAKLIHCRTMADADAALTEMSLEISPPALRQEQGRH